LCGTGGFGLVFAGLWIWIHLGPDPDLDPVFWFISCFFLCFFFFWFISCLHLNLDPGLDPAIDSDPDPGFVWEPGLVGIGIDKRLDPGLGLDASGSGSATRQKGNQTIFV
jgi:hypothetical protein